MSLNEQLFIDEKQAAQRYSYSRPWFQRARWNGSGPKFLKVGAKILYPLSETDAWFMQHGLRNSTSEEQQGVKK